MVETFGYLGVMLESTGGWNKQKTLAVIAMDKCISVKCHVNQTLCMELTWGLSEAWREVDKVHSRSCKYLMGIPNYAANGFVEMELGREQERQVRRINSEVLVSDHVFGYRRTNKTKL